MVPAVGVVSAAGADGERAPSDGPVLGLDIGGTKLAAGVVDAAGVVHSFAAEPSRADEGPKPTLARLFELGRRVVAESPLEWEDVQAVGIGCGGPLDAQRGVLIAPPHLPGWRNVPVTELAARAFDRPVTLENDATAAA